MKIQTANNKQDAKNYSSSGIEFDYSNDLMKLLYDFHTDIGATKELPTDKIKVKEYLVRLHETITVKNPLYPNDVNFDMIYGVWMMAVIYEEAPRYGNNISALARCFNEWYKKNSDQFIKPSQDHIVSKYRNIKDFSNVEIARLYDVVEMLNDGDLIGGLFNTGGAQSFFKRLKSEHIARGL